MDVLPWIIAVVVAFAGGVLVSVALLRRRKRVEPLPTDWALTPRPVFSTAERRVYQTLREALPGHVILAKLPLVRFCQPIEVDDIRYWYDLLGSTHVSFAVCGLNGRVLAAIDLETSRGESRRVMQIKQSVLGACRVRYLRCAADNLPSSSELQVLVPPSTARVPPSSASPDLDQARDHLASAVAKGRAQRSARWETSSTFNDSFFAPDSRMDGFGPSEYGGLATEVSTRFGSDLGQLPEAEADPHAIGGVVVDAPPRTP